MNRHVDPYETEEYAKFVASCVPLCHCSESMRPCDGVLAGGICDGIGDRDEPEKFDDERDEQDED